MIQKGVCLLTMAPMRIEPNNTSEMVSMLLFGETFGILTEKDEWVEILCDYDQYNGWVNKKLITIITQAFDSNSDVLCARSFCEIQSGKQGKILLSPGSTLPNFMQGTCAIESDIYVANNAITKPFGSLVDTAQLFLNTPYLWGGRCLAGIDCSGLTQVVFKMHGIKLLRDASQQATQGETINFRGAALSGDLAFFDNENGKITHVGIIMNDTQIIHASGKVRIDKMDDYGIINQESGKYSHKLRIIKRVN